MSMSKVLTVNPRIKMGLRDLHASYWCNKQKKCVLKMGHDQLGLAYPDINIFHQPTPESHQGNPGRKCTAFLRENESRKHPLSSG